MRRFLLGLLLGACASGIAYGTGAPPLWIAVVGIGVAVAVWSGHAVFEAVTDFLDDLL